MGFGFRLISGNRFSYDHDQRIGVLGWGVGGIEAGQLCLAGSLHASTRVVGFELTGKLRPGVTATDMTLRIVEMLREHGCVGKFVEFHGSGLGGLSLPDRATIANMAPEYGATCGFFPVDQTTLDYLLLSGREPAHVEDVKRYLSAQGLFYSSESATPNFSSNLNLELSTVEPSLSGPKRPQDRVSLTDMKSHWRSLNSPQAIRARY